MSGKAWAWGLGAAGIGMLLYGAFVEAEKLQITRHRLRLRRWPAEMDGYRIALLADFHIRDNHTVALAKRAVEAALAAKPDLIVIAGDFVGYWKPESPWLIGEALEGLGLMAGRALAVPGNHDYWSGDASLLTPICEELGIRLLRNESICVDGIRWVGVDSFNAKRADPMSAFGEMAADGDTGPTICLWHEPDAVRYASPSCDLMLSGHSHGGQFVLPGGFAPMKTKNGRRYLRGFYPNAPIPLFVTRGIGTTGPPSRFLCPPEIALLTLGQCDGIPRNSV